MTPEQLAALRLTLLGLVSSPTAPRLNTPSSVAGMPA